jgi:hypothetical protein
VKVKVKEKDQVKVKEKDKVKVKEKVKVEMVEKRKRNRKTFETETEKIIRSHHKK